MKKTMGEILRELRKERGLTQEEVGNIIGVKKAAIQKYEKGNVENMKRSSIQILSDFYNVTPAYLMGMSVSSDKEMADCMEILERKPELKKILNMLKNANSEEIEKAIKIIETIKG